MSEELFERFGAVDESGKRHEVEIWQDIVFAFSLSNPDQIFQGKRRAVTSEGDALVSADNVTFTFVDGGKVLTRI